LWPWNGGRGSNAPEMLQKVNLRKARRCWHFVLCGVARKYLGLRYKIQEFETFLSLILFKLPNLFTNFNWGKNHHHVSQFSFGSLENKLLASLLLQRANLKWRKNKKLQKLRESWSPILLLSQLSQAGV